MMYVPVAEEPNENFATGTITLNSDHPCYNNCMNGSSQNSVVNSREDVEDAKSSGIVFNTINNTIRDTSQIIKNGVREGSQIMYEMVNAEGEINHEVQDTRQSLRESSMDQRQKLDEKQIGTENRLYQLEQNSPIYQDNFKKHPFEENSYQKKTDRKLKKDCKLI